MEEPWAQTRDGRSLALLPICCVADVSRFPSLGAPACPCEDIHACLSTCPCSPGDWMSSRMRKLPTH